MAHVFYSQILITLNVIIDMCLLCKHYLGETTYPGIHICSLQGQWSRCFWTCGEESVVKQNCCVRAISM